MSLQKLTRLKKQLLFNNLSNNKIDLNLLSLQILLSQKSVNLRSFYRKKIIQLILLKILQRLRLRIILKRLLK